MTTIEREKRRLTTLSTIIAVVAAAMIAYHMISTQRILVSYIEHQNIHLAFSLVLAFLSSFQASKKRWWTLLLIFLVLSVVATAYIQIFFRELTIERQSFPILPDVIIGTILIIVVLEATRRAFGLILPIVSLAFVLYAFFGYLLPTPLTTIQYSFGKLISKLAVAQGMYGTVLSISASYLFLFMAFGAVLQISGATKFFIEVGKLVGRKLAGGTALAAVVSSGLLGGLTGSVSSNVAMVGPYTIPMIKRAGYTAEQAAAIQAAASTGEQFPPPVMGAAAFIMAGITGISYFKIMTVAIIPAILYYLVLGLYVQLQAIKMGVKPAVEKVDVRAMLQTAHLFLVPLGVLVALLAYYTPMYAIFWTILSIIVLSLIRKETRPTLREWAEGLSNGANLGAQIGVSTALIGVIVTSITLTGLGLRLPGLVETLSGGNLGIALVLTAIIALILGCGMPTTFVYLLVAIVTAPILIRMGLPLLTAHFFVFYYAVMGFVTPPVAIGALIAAKMAGSNYIKTGIEATKAALGGFIVPFLIILAPVLILEPPQEPFLLIVAEVIASLVILTTFEIAATNHYLTPLDVGERVAAIVSGAALFAFLITKSYLFTAGFFLFILVTWRQLRRRRVGGHQRQ